MSYTVRFSDRWNSPPPLASAQVPTASKALTLINDLRLSGQVVRAIELLDRGPVQIWDVMKIAEEEDASSTPGLGPRDRLGETASMSDDATA